MEKSLKMDNIAVSIKTIAEESAKEMQKQINTLTTAGDLLKNLPIGDLEKILSEHGMGDFFKQFIEGAADSKESVENLAKSFDQVRKVYKDIDALQKSTNSGYKESAEATKAIYEAQKKAAEANKKLTVDQRKETKELLDMQLKALDTLSKKQEELTNKNLERMKKEKAEFLSLHKLMEEKFNKSAGSSVLGALMGARESGNVTQFLLNKLGSATGIAGSLENSSLAKALAKGFDLSDTNKKISENTSTSADIDKKEFTGGETKKMGAAGTAVLTALGLGAAAHGATKYGIHGVGHVVDAVQGLKDPMGYYKGIFGTAGGAAVGKIFGKETGNVFSGIVGQLLDAVTFKAQRGWESNLHNVGNRAEGSGKIDLMSAMESFRISSEEAQNIDNAYNPMGYKFGNGLNSRIRMLDVGRHTGEDVLQAGYGAISRYKDQKHQNEALNETLGTFEAIRKSSQGVGASVKEVTKQLFKTAEAARFLNVDMKAIVKLQGSLFQLGNSRMLMGQGVDVKNGQGSMINNLLTFSKDNLALQYYLQGAAGDNYQNEDERLSGTYLHHTAGYMKKNFTMGPNGYTIRGSAQESIDDSNNYAIQQIKTLKDTLLKPGGFGKAMMLGKSWGLNEDTLKTLLSSDSLDKNKMSESIQAFKEGQKTPLEKIVSSAAMMQGFQSHTVEILTSILAVLIALPIVIRDAFVGTPEEKAQSGNFMQGQGKTIMNSLGSIKGASRGMLNSFSNAINMYDKDRLKHIMQNMSDEAKIHGTNNEGSLGVNAASILLENKKYKGPKGKPSSDADIVRKREELFKYYNGADGENSDRDSIENTPIKKVGGMNGGTTIHINVPNGSLLTTGRQIIEIIEKVRAFDA